MLPLKLYKFIQTPYTSARHTDRKTCSEFDKTVRKYFGEAIVVTQEVEDIISSPIVKESIINNSDCKILLDQRKYLNKFDSIQNLLGLTDSAAKNQKLSEAGAGAIVLKSLFEEQIMMEADWMGDPNRSSMWWVSAPATLII